MGWVDKGLIIHNTTNHFTFYFFFGVTLGNFLSFTNFSNLKLIFANTQHYNSSILKNFTLPKKWSFLDILGKILRMSQGLVKSHVSIYRWNQRWISFKLSPSNRNYGDHWKCDYGSCNTRN